MPTYQYACTDSECGNRFELVQKFTDPAADECPVCGSPVRKVFSSVGVVFKGSGFYRNDSREGAKSGAKSSGDSGASKESAKSGDSASGDSASSTNSDSAKSDSAKSGSDGGSAKGTSSTGATKSAGSGTSTKTGASA